MLESSSVSVLRQSSILVTGGTGSFGKTFVRHMLDHLDPQRLVIFSRDELKQYEMRQMFHADPRLHWVLGDVRDRDRLRYAMHGIDHVVHAAALKQVDTAEYQPFEFVKTNIDGAQNVIETAAEKGVRKVVALSTDKASSPINLYGATKMVSDKLFTSANRAWARHGTLFSVVRYGNVMGSRGSVVPLFRKLASEGASLPITDKRMTRFCIPLAQAAKFVVNCFDEMRGGELFVPRIPSMKVTDLVEAIAPGCPNYEVGIRPGEKLHEEMIAREDSHRAFQSKDRYVVVPTVGAEDYVPPEGSQPVPEGFAYRSNTNDLWLSVDELRALLDLDAV